MTQLMDSALQILLVNLSVSFNGRYTKRQWMRLMLCLWILET